MSDESMCVCGHVWDEHDSKTVACQVDDCPCFQFELDPDPVVDLDEPDDG